MSKVEIEIDGGRSSLCPLLLNRRFVDQCFGNLGKLHLPCIITSLWGQALLRIYKSSFFCVILLREFETCIPKNFQKRDLASNTKFIFPKQRRGNILPWGGLVFYFSSDGSKLGIHLLLDANETEVKKSKFFNSVLHRKGRKLTVCIVHKKWIKCTSAVT